MYPRPAKMPNSGLTSRIIVSMYGGGNTNLRSTSMMKYGTKPHYTHAQLHILLHGSDMAFVKKPKKMKMLNTYIHTYIYTYLIQVTSTLREM